MVAANDRRLAGTDRGQRLEISVDGESVPAYEGESVAAAMLAASRRGLRTTPGRGEFRGIYCGIGLCFDCVVTVDGQRPVRACQTGVREGMCVETLQGNGVWPAVCGDAEDATDDADLAGAR